MLRYQKQITITSIAVLLATLCAPTFAQFGLDTPSTDYFDFPLPGMDITDIDQTTTILQLFATPATPTTNQEVKVDARAIGFEEGDAIFEWFLDGKRFSPPVKGLDSITFTASAVAGTKHLIRADVLLPNGSKRSSSIIISVVEVVIGVEFDTLIPPRYKGAAVGGNEATVKLWALPFGLGSARDIEYRWYIDNKKFAGGVAVQEATAKLGGGRLIPVKVHLQLINERQGINFDKVFSFRMWEPELVLYDGTPSSIPNPNRRRGVVAGTLLPSERITVWPYFFNVTTPAQLRPSWFVDGKLNPLITSFIAQPFLDFPLLSSSLNILVSNPSSYSEQASLRAGLLLNR